MQTQEDVANWMFQHLGVKRVNMIENGCKAVIKELTEKQVLVLPELNVRWSVKIKRSGTGIVVIAEKRNPTMVELNSLKRHLGRIKRYQDHQFTQEKRELDSKAYESSKKEKEAEPVAG